MNIALNYAANWNQIEAMQLLLDRGAQINAQPPGYYRPEDPGASALLEAVRWLLDHGADPTLRALRGVPE